MSLFDDIISAERLHAGWRRVRQNKGVAGGDGVGIDRFEQHLGDNLAHLRGALANERYRPGPLQCVDIAKPGGGWRRLAIPPVRDRVVQSAAAIALDREAAAIFESLGEDDKAATVAAAIGEIEAAMTPLARSASGGT